MPWSDNDGQVKYLWTIRMGVIALSMVDHWFGNFEWCSLLDPNTFLPGKVLNPQILSQILPQKALGSIWYLMLPETRGIDYLPKRGKMIGFTKKHVSKKLCIQWSFVMLPWKVNTFHMQRYEPLCTEHMPELIIFRRGFSSTTRIRFLLVSSFFWCSWNLGPVEDAPSLTGGGRHSGRHQRCFRGPGDFPGGRCVAWRESRAFG